MRHALLLVLTLTAGCNVVLGFGSPTQAADDLRVSITPTTASPTDPYFAFDVAIANDGPDDATQVMVDVGLPSDAMTEAYSLKLGLIVPRQMQTALTQVTAKVSASSADPISVNDTVTIEQTLTDHADLGLAITATPDPVASGGTFKYSVVARNFGPSEASNVTVTDTLPAGVSFVNVMGAGWTCSASGQDVTCTRPTLTVASAPAIDIVVTASATAGTITNTAVVSSANPDANASNDTVSVTSTVGP